MKSESAIITKIAEQRHFLTVRFFTVFWSTEKNGKSSKKGARIETAGEVRRSRGARRGGKEGKPLRDRWETELDLTRQHPGGVRRMTESALPARLKLQVMSARTLGVFQGGAPGKLREGHEVNRQGALFFEFFWCFFWMFF